MVITTDFVVIESGIQISLEALTTEGKNFSTEDEKQTQGATTNTSTDSSPHKLTASVALPSSLFNSIKATSNLTYIGIFFSIYKTACYFHGQVMF